MSTASQQSGRSGHERASFPRGAPTDHFLPGERNVPRQQRIYTNRNLRMDKIHAIGFDMDHTLALYNRQTFEQLTFDMAVENLVSWKGYPEAVRDVRYEPNFIIRGLVVDKRYGNILKMDLHGYVALAYHGMQPLNKQERIRRYRNLRLNLKSQRYQSFDTLFSMPEGSLYAALIDMKKQDRRGPMARVKLSQIFDDVRNCVDKVHRDGSLKSVILRDLPRYFIEDPLLRPTLQRFRALGKKIFLVTNSEHDYTEQVMSFLLNRGGESWKSLFDLVIVESKKPGFFMNGREAAAIAQPQDPRGHDFFFRAGNASFVERILGADGDQVLYFGDHTYGDILRSKKTVGWRTAMIVHELEHEIAAFERQGYVRREISDLISKMQDLRRDLDQTTLLLSAAEELDRQGAAADAIPPWAGDYLRRELRDFLALGELDRESWLEGMREVVRGLEFVAEQTGARTRTLDAHVRESHNPWWGQLFREGNKTSRFGRQVKEFACIYTSRVANFLNYPGNFYFLAPEESMPHER